MSKDERRHTKTASQHGPGAFSLFSLFRLGISTIENFISLKGSTGKHFVKKEGIKKNNKKRIPRWIVTVCVSDLIQPSSPVVVLSSSIRVWRESTYRNAIYQMSSSVELPKRQNKKTPSSMLFFRRQFRNSEKKTTSTTWSVVFSVSAHSFPI